MSSSPALTAVEALGSIPDLIRSSLGERSLERCLSSAGLPMDVSDRQGNYVTEASIERLLARAAQQAGDDLFGLSLFPHLSIREYGVWGDYVLGARTLRHALRRASDAIHLHADRDTLVFREGAVSCRLEYMFAERTGHGYRQIALAALGPMFSIPRHFLGKSWLPLSIDLDLGENGSARRIEAVLDLQVRTDRNCVAMEIANRDIETGNPANQRSWTTIEDVTRACRGGPPTGLVQIVEHLIRQRIGVDGVVIDDVAKSMSISRRTLQRHLDREGAEFRMLVGRVKMSRARELLASSPLTVSEIGLQLGYSTAGHFARAFRNAYETSPMEYRASKSR